MLCPTELHPPLAPTILMRVTDYCLRRAYFIYAFTLVTAGQRAGARIYVPAVPTHYVRVHVAMSCVHVYQLSSTYS